MALTLEDADRMVKAAIAEAKRLNLQMSMAVCDAGGHLLAFNRTEGCIWIAAQAAQAKAVSSSAIGIPSGDLPAESPVIQAIMATQGGRMIAAQGALPVIQNGVVVGAIGGSGGTAQEDEDCARVGLAAL